MLLGLPSQASGYLYNLESTLVYLVTLMVMYWLVRCVFIVLDFTILDLTADNDNLAIVLL